MKKRYWVLSILVFFEAIDILAECPNESVAFHLGALSVGFIRWVVIVFVFSWIYDMICGFREARRKNIS